MTIPKILEVRPSYSKLNEPKSTKKGKEKPKKKKMPEFLKKHVMLKLDEHIISLDELCERLNTNAEKGLTEDTAKENMKRYGENLLSPPTETHPLSRYFVHNVQGLAGIAWIGIIVCWLTFLIEAFANTVREPDIENIYLGLTMTLFVMINGTVSFCVEWRAKRFLRTMKSTISHFTVVIRNGERKIIDTKEITLGDLIEVRAGDRVPADIRVVKSSHFMVDNSSLTGQEEPVKIQPGLTNDNPLLTTNLVFLSTFALEGTCQGIVFNIGDKTVVGHITRRKSTLKQVQTLLTKSVIRIILVYSIIGMCFSLSFCIFYMRVQLSWLETTLIFVAVYVACVPEQILLALLVILTVIGKKMQRHDCLPKHFHTIETLGSISYILTDKTGIVTDTKFAVNHVWGGQGIISVNEDSFILLEDSIGFKALLRCAMLCGKPELWNFENSECNNVGNQKYPNCGWTKTRALQMALISFTQKTASETEFSDWSNDASTVHESLFSSTRKYYLSVHSLKDHSRQLVVIMGAPEAVLKHCFFINIGSKKKPITEKIRVDFNQAVEEMASKGESVFAFADMFLEVDYNEQVHVHRHSFRLLGLISMQNPLRASIPNAISKCRSASIKVIMISRDHPSTTRAIAKDAGIITGETGLVINGELLSALTHEELDKLIKDNDEIVFANTSPIHKLQIVQSCQRLGGRVAVTGIDIKDCPALKAADIGVVPSSGSDILKQAADLILLDDSFSTIVAGIEDGRLIYENLQKCLLYIITSVIPQIGPFLLYMILRIPRPLGAFSVLLITISTELLPVLALPLEDAEYDLMKESPKDIHRQTLLDSSIFRRAYFQIGVLQFLAGMFAYLVVLIDNGFYPMMLMNLSRRWDSPAETQIEDFYGQEWRKELEFTSHSAFFFAVIMTQIANLITCRTKNHSIFRQGKKNWVLFGVIVSMFVIGIFCASLPSGHLEEALKHRQLMWYWFLPSLPFILLILAWEEFRRYMSRRHPRSGWV